MNRFRRPNTKRTSNEPANGIDSSSSDPDTVSPVDDAAIISASVYARKCRLLMDLNNDLRAMGADQLIVLPRIAVIGGQSAGKSSLVEAVSGINVPRDSGTCTRCPLDCSMTRSTESWSCSISLRFDYDDASGQQLANPTRIPFGSPITDKNLVEIWLRRAQSAILSRPYLSPETFLAKTYAELQTATKTDPNILKFSRNAVCLEIKDPDATDLSFIDLPGLIQNAAEDMVQLVKNLVVSYIDGERSANTLILITIPMSDDMENQTAVRLAREADPAGERTVGVLTKPDTLGSGAKNALENWKNLLEGRHEAHSLKNGYYCVRLPDDRERSENLTRSESQTRAARFFDSTAPWKDVGDRGRFGIPALISDMSQLLLHVIEDSIPKLKEDVDRLLAEYENELAKLPAPLMLDPTTEIILMITAFCNDFNGAVYGHGIKTLAQRNRKRYKSFKEDIWATAPDFRPFFYHTRYHKPPSIDNEEFNRTNPAVKPLNLRDVGKVIADSIAWELPYNVPFEAKVVLIKQFTDRWEAPALCCFDDVFATLSDIMHSLLATHFARFKPLESHIESLTEQQMNVCKEQALQAIKKTLDLEKAPLFTQNNYFNLGREKWLRHYKALNAAWRRYLIHVPQPEYCDRAATPASEQWGEVERGMAEERLPVSAPPSPSPEPEPGWSEVEEDLVVMADVRAYFQVAYKRIIDYIPLTIEYELSQAIVRKLQTVLIESLFTGGSAEWRRSLLDEDPAIFEKRQKLEGTKERLTEIKRRLADFGRDTLMA